MAMGVLPSRDREDKKKIFITLFLNQKAINCIRKPRTAQNLCFKLVFCFYLFFRAFPAITSIENKKQIVFNAETIRGNETIFEMFFFFLVGGNS